MISLDTNVLVRLFVDDKSSREQAQLVRDFLRYHKTVYVCQMVQIELVWVLETCYEFDKTTIINVLKLLQDRDDFVLENPQQFQQALQWYKNANADFSDYLIAANSQENGLAFFTFDKKLSKTSYAVRLTRQFINELKEK